MEDSAIAPHTTAVQPSPWVADTGPRLIVAAVLVGVAYYVGAQAGFTMLFPASPISMLWPPNGKMVPLTIEGVTDAVAGSVTITITGIQQNEPIPNSAGDTSPDSLIGADGSFQLKAERVSDGNGRVYAVSFLASNGTPGGEATGTVYVTVPHNTVEKSTVAGGQSKKK